MSLENALPGASKQKTFTISSSSTSTDGVKYGVNLKITQNSFTGDDLVYSLNGTASGASDGSGTTIATVNEGTIGNVTNGNKFLGSGTLMPGEKHTYTLVMRFKETGSDQNSNQGKSFEGAIQVTTGDETDTSRYYNASNSEGTTTAPSSESSEDFPTD